MTGYSVVAGLRRGTTELRGMLTSPQDMGGVLFFSALTLTALFLMRNSTAPGTHLSLGSLALPGALGMGVASMGMTIMAQMLTISREDGTLLRVKAIPGGIVSFFTGLILMVSGMTVVAVLVQLIAGAFLLGGVGTGDPGSWLLLAGVFVIGLVATLPYGAIFGSLFPSPRSGGLIMLPFFGITAISGIFYPITAFPVWVQDIGQVFPIYWLGLGMRSALLPNNLAAVEIGGSWRHLETFGVLAGWAVLGLILAPIVLRRMARRESGSLMVARRERAMRRVV